MISYIHAVLILIVSCATISIIVKFIRELRINFKTITKNDIVDNYYNFQLFHLKEFKKAINNELKKCINEGHRFPIHVTYEKILSKDSLDILREYIKTTLKFENFELEQKDEWVCCHLSLRG